MITRLPMPERAIKVINDLGKFQKNSGFKNNMEFWDLMKIKYDWENEYLDAYDGKVEIKPVNAYPHIPVEIPGVILESHLQPDEGAVQANTIPIISYLAADTRKNAGLATTPRVL